MKQLVFTILILLLVSDSFSQKIPLVRKSFKYEKLEKENYDRCDETVMVQLEKPFAAVDQNSSSLAVSLSKDLFSKNGNCPETYECYAYCLFRSGMRLEAIALLDSAIEKFGSNPELIYRKAYLSFELGELGPTVKNIDGSGVYTSSEKSEYEEAQFKEENFRSALADLRYLTSAYSGRDEDEVRVAYIHSQLGEYEKANQVLENLLDREGYQETARYMIAENMIELKQYRDAEKILLELSKINPRETSIYKKLYQLYDLQKEEAKKTEAKNKFTFYQCTPAFSDLVYNEKNYAAINYFLSEENKGKDKVKKLNSFYKKESKGFTIDLCLSILKMHANHENALEQQATDLLAKIGKPAIAKSILLFESENISTCSISNLAEVMATVKDTASWRALVNYLPLIGNMPMTLIPPSVPSSLVAFDAGKGTYEILKVVKVIYETKENESGGSDNMMNHFGEYAYYLPLEKMSREKITAIAKQLNYTDSQMKILMGKIYGDK